MAALGLAGAPAASANLVGIIDDPPGDSSDPAPARDLLDAALAYDRRRGGLTGTVRFRGAPTSDTAGLVTLFAGRRTAEGCNGYPALGFSTYTDGNYPRWHVFDAPGATGVYGETRKSGARTAVQQFEAVDRRMAGKRPDCMIATLTAPGDASIVYDSTGPIPLVAQPVTQIRLRNVPKRMPANRTRRIRVTVSNAGDAPTGPVRLRVAAARGLRAAPKTSRLRTIAPGKSRTVTLRVSLSSRARAQTPLKLTATAGKQKVEASARIALQRPARKNGSGGGGSGSDRPPTLCNRWIPDISGETGGSLGLVPC
ncbi:MAG: hypothetical protein ITG02_01805 [Patulibacter sp.]|nr:hypothetical protein [Patulibacter sp.]